MENLCALRNLSRRGSGYWTEHKALLFPTIYESSPSGCNNLRSIAASIIRRDGASR